MDASTQLQVVVDDNVDSRRLKSLKFKKMQIEKNVLELKSEMDRYLLDSIEDSSNDKFDILFCGKIIE